MTEGAGDAQPLKGSSQWAGVRELINESYDDLKPLEDAPFEISNWDPDTQAEPDETAQPQG